MLNGRRRIQNECIVCYNRNADLWCDTCPIKVQEECTTRAGLRLPVQCETWDDYEWSRIGVPREWIEWYGQEGVVNYVKARATLKISNVPSEGM